MSDQSSIEWTDATWNPVRGCSKVSPGCKHCYAETFAERFRGTPNHPYEQGFDLRLPYAKLPEPLRWARARKIFVNSMSDLFHEQVPEPYVEEVFRVMVQADWHVYQLLTKRADRLRAISHALGPKLVVRDHIWLGVSVEDRKYGLPRIDALRKTRAGKRFLSIEPLLEDLGPIDLRGIDWVIVGGESGRGARPMHADWAINIREQCHLPRFRSSSSSGAGSTRRKPAVNSRGHTTRTSRWPRPAMFRTARVGGRCWRAQRRAQRRSSGCWGQFRSCRFAERAEGGGSAQRGARSRSSSDDLG